MVRRSVRRKLAAAALFTAALTGCKNGFEIPVWNPFAKADKNALHTDSDGGHWQNEEIQPRESGLTKSFKKLGETVSKPFKKQPAEVTVPEDEALTPVTKNGPLEPGLYVSLAAMEAKAGRTKAAVEQYNKALGVDPNHLDALLGLARLYDREDDPSQAIEYYRRAVKAHPENAKPINDLGLCYARCGRLDESIATLHQAVSAQPQNPLYRNNLAAVLVEGGRTSEALRTLKPAFGEAGAHYNVGVVLKRCGRIDEAIRHIERAAELDPELAQARQLLAALREENPAEERDALAEAPEARPPAPLNRAAVEARPVSRQPETVQTDAVPLDAPIATPYVPQSDIAPKARPISRSTTVERVDPRPAEKPTMRMPPMNPHQPPKVEIPPEAASSDREARPQADAASEELIGPKLMQKRPATGDRYEVVGPSRAYPTPPPSPPAQQTSVAARGGVPATSGATRPAPAASVPPLPEQVSTLPAEPDTAAPKARTAAGGARYPASRF